jgi:L-threonylcarbamoyladenylate synthase
MILTKKPSVPDLVTAGFPSVALRVPSHRVARALMEMAGVPVAAPSANRFSRPSPTTAAHVLDDLDGRIDLLLDAGPTDIGLESTIVDFTVNPPVLRRPGGITLEQVQSLVPEVTLATGQGGIDDPQVAPGQMTRHYAPKAELTFYEGPTDAVIRRVAADSRSATAAGERVGILAPEEDLLALAPEIAGRASSGRIESLPYGSRRDLERSGRELYAAIRALDATGVTRIFAIGVGSEGLARALRDRLMRAADGRIRHVLEG